MGTNSILTIIKGQEFKVVDKHFIGEDDIFLDQYKKAAEMLNTIVNESKESVENHFLNEYENNIIAFCGERGEGKSSAMLTFINSLYVDYEKIKNEKDNIYSIYNEYLNLKKTYFSQPIFVDPSQFDGIHNILDIILAKIYRKFSRKYEENQCTKEFLVNQIQDQFQKVYREVSMINNQSKMLDDEFDYEGNISKLSKLGESTNLKEDFQYLIELYLKFMMNEEIENKYLVIAIDDLDLCNEAAYKMSEQIRKYLIIPHVVIVMAVKTDQLELAIREKNIKEYKHIINCTKSSDWVDEKTELNNEIYDMAERYVSKLIPKARRIYLPKAQKFESLQIIYKNNQTGEIKWQSNTNTLVQSVLELIYEKTGMIFLEEKTGMSFLIPNNLRDIISWIVQLGDMDSPGKTDNPQNTYRKNIEEFYYIFKWDWMNRELTPRWKNWLSALENMDVIHTNTNIRKKIKPFFKWSDVTENIADQKDKDGDGERVVEYFENLKYFEIFNDNIFDPEIEKILYGIKSIYTFKFNQLLLENKLFKPKGYINGYIWGTGFSKVIPSVQTTRLDRSRFIFKTSQEYNEILECYFKSGIRMDEQEKVVKVPQIVKDTDRKTYIKCWILIGLLTNSYYEDNIWRSGGVINKKIIAGNGNLLSNVQNSIENYLVVLGDVEVLFDKINLEQIGVEREDEEYKEIIENIKKSNKKSILCAQKIASNVDLAMRIKEYCKDHNDHKDGTISSLDRSIEVVNKFFENIAYYMTHYLAINVTVDDLRYFKFNSTKNSDDENNEIKNEIDKVDICEIYARLIEKKSQEIEGGQKQNVFDKGNELVQQFRDKITVESTTYINKIKRVSTYLKNTSAENAKGNLDNLANNIQYYRGIKKKLPENLDTEKLCGFYEQVIQIYLQDVKTQLSQELYSLYKQMVKIEKDIENELK